MTCRRLKGTLGMDLKSYILCINFFWPHTVNGKQINLNGIFDFWFESRVFD